MHTMIWLCPILERFMVAQLGGWTVGGSARQTDGQADGQTDRRPMGRRMDGQPDRRADGQPNRPRLPSVSNYGKTERKRE